MSEQIEQEILNEITGIFDRRALRRLAQPLAWNGSPAAKERAEAAIRAVVSEGIEILDSNPDALAVEIDRGKIVSTIV